MRLFCLVILLFVLSFFLEARAQTDSTHVFRGKQLIAPLALTASGAAGISIRPLDHWQKDLQQSIAGDRRIGIDNYLQYSPTAAVYVLNLCGLKGMHNFRDRTLILATSALVTASAVTAVKYSVKEMRPDGSSANSYPSGHTATAFMGAEFLWMEYKDSNPWIGAGGFLLATCTGLMRMYNNRHYLYDVITGAGVGILSVRIAYWLYPPLQRGLFGKEDNGCSITAVPYFDEVSSSAGFGCVVTF